MGEARRRKQAGNMELPRGRFILYGTFRKTGDIWLEDVRQRLTATDRLVFRCTVETSETGSLVSTSSNDLRPSGPVT
jgi:hypothetical protein